MNGRPSLTTELNAQTFRQYYYLKEELVDFCRKNDLQAIGNKLDGWIEKRLKESK